MGPNPEDTSICPDCGYSLAGLATVRCPECGADTRERRRAILAAISEVRTRRRVLLTTLPAAISACVWPFVAFFAVLAASLDPAGAGAAPYIAVPIALGAMVSVAVILRRQDHIVVADKDLFGGYLTIAWWPVAAMFVCCCFGSGR